MSSSQKDWLDTIGTSSIMGMITSNTPSPLKTVSISATIITSDNKATSDHRKPLAKAT